MDREMTVADSIVRGGFLLKLVCVLQQGDAIWLTMPASGNKCVSEEIQNNVVVLADYIVISDDRVHRNPTIAVKVQRVFGLQSPYGKTLHRKENVTNGEFAFTTTEAGNYVACFWIDSHNEGGGEISVNIDWKMGIADYVGNNCDGLDIIHFILCLCKGVELELRKLEGAVEAIHENLLYLKSSGKCLGGMVQYLVIGSLHSGISCTDLVLKEIFPKEVADISFPKEIFCETTQILLLDAVSKI
ncbi:transmembrane emp24 domain-containing p24delta3-like [Olea europaea subsp. europaea]|uniref:Transmembrane emp24 domain-containing p24delta3-like n=1 Tax=Olea europaea subsp. europaea TaxID=158383 RepID=A0A8S0RQP0_OLEEU|nr:transmembrane emp24 domain-containing p24delta3-like [Olea europaea subsp. europaea]